MTCPICNPESTVKIADEYDLTLLIVREIGKNIIMNIDHNVTINRSAMEPTGESWIIDFIGKVTCAVMEGIRKDLKEKANELPNM